VSVGHVHTIFMRHPDEHFNMVRYSYVVFDGTGCDQTSDIFTPPRGSNYPPVERRPPPPLLRVIFSDF